MANFTELPQELRDQIWAEAVAIQCQQRLLAVTIIDEPCNTPHAERQRQALVGYDSIPDSTERECQRQPLRLYIHASHQSNELRLGENEFQTLINRLPMATACSESRAHAIKFCHAQIKFVTLFRVIGDQVLDEKPILEQPVFTNMTTVMVTTSRFHPEDGPEGFDSPDQVVDVIARVFGSGVKKIIWSPWCQFGFTMSDIYWPHTPLLLAQLPEREFDLINRSGHDETAHFLSLDLVLHIQKDLYEAETPSGHTNYDCRLLLRHTLKLHEIVRAAAKPLPQLQHIEVEMRTYSWGEIYMTHLETTYRDNMIWIGKHNLATAIFHYFSHGTRWH